MTSEDRQFFIDQLASLRTEMRTLFFDADEHLRDVRVDIGALMLMAKAERETVDRVGADVDKLKQHAGLQ